MNEHSHVKHSTSFGQLQVTEYKFAGERVIESLWPFNKMVPPRNFYALILSYFMAGTSLTVLLKIPTLTIIIGGFAAIGITLWTWALIRYAQNFRETEIYDLNKVKSKFLTAFLQNVFSDFSVVMAIIFYIMTVAYLFTFGQDVMPRIAGYQTLNLSTAENWVLYSYFLVMVFDVNFRVSLTLYVCICIHKRNFLLSKLLRNMKMLIAFQRRDLQSLLKIDSRLFFIAGSQILFYPFSYYDSNLYWFLTAYVPIAVMLIVMSMIHLKYLERVYF